MKPHISRLRWPDTGKWLWRCASDDAAGLGLTTATAHENWVTCKQMVAADRLNTEFDAALAAAIMSNRAHGFPTVAVVA